MVAKIGVLTISDRASVGQYEDKSGPAIVDTLNELLISPWTPFSRVVPDETDQIQAALRQLASVDGCSLILTTGGTGPAVRDVTPEATAAVCQKMLPGFGELMRQKSLQQVSTAILSRQTAGILDTTLIINLPGRPASIRLCLLAVFPAVPYCLDLIGGARIETDPEVCNAFRPG